MVGFTSEHNNGEKRKFQIAHTIYVNIVICGHNSIQMLFTLINVHLFLSFPPSFSFSSPSSARSYISELATKFDLRMHGFFAQFYLFPVFSIWKPQPCHLTRVHFLLYSHFCSYSVFFRILLRQIEDEQNDCSISWKAYKSDIYFIFENFSISIRLKCNVDPSTCTCEYIAMLSCDQFSHSVWTIKFLLQVKRWIYLSFIAIFLSVFAVIPFRTFANLYVSIFD